MGLNNKQLNIGTGFWNREYREAINLTHYHLDNQWGLIFLRVIWGRKTIGVLVCW